MELPAFSIINNALKHETKTYSLMVYTFYKICTSTEDTEVRSCLAPCILHKHGRYSVIYCFKQNINMPEITCFKQFKRYFSLMHR